MGQFFTDDVDALLKAGHGDTIRLTKIKTDFTATKLVTIEDRKYVESLVSRYLHHTNEKPKKTIESRIVPPPPIPKSAPPNLYEIKQSPREEKPIAKVSEKVRIRNIAVIIVTVIASIAIVGIIAINQDKTIGIESPITNSLEIDSSAYVRGDIISVSGRTLGPTSTVRLVITDPDGQSIWNDAVTVKPDQTFSTLVLAGEGWDKSGQHTLSMTYSDITETITFNFDSRS